MKSTTKKEIKKRHMDEITYIQLLSLIDVLNFKKDNLKIIKAIKRLLQHE